MNSNETTPRKRATIKDVARLAGVSPGTVSNALSGKRRVDSATQERISKAIQTLGYVPNLAARGMRTGRAGTVAVFSSMPIAVAAGSSRLGFLMEIAASAAITAMQGNSALLLIPPISDPAAALSTIAFDGAILVEPGADDPYLSLLAARGVPTVVIGPATDTGESAVLLDYEAMAALLFDHLLEEGARNITLIVGQSPRASNRVFREVYLARCRETGRRPSILDVPEAEAEEGARQALAAELDKAAAPDGVLVPIDAMASGAMMALRQAGLTVPDQVKIATRYDGLRARSETPPLTALDLHLDVVADTATRTLLEILDSGSADRALTVPGPELVIRGSTRKVTDWD